MEPPTLEGADLRLRPLRLNDAPALAAAAAESRSTYNYTHVPGSVPEATAAIEAALEQAEAGTRLPFMIEWRGRDVGSTSFCDLQYWQWPPGHAQQRQGVPDVVEIGYTWLAASAQRTVCNTGAKFLLLRHALEVWRVHRVSLRTDARNTRCREAVARLGAQFEGVRRADKPGSDGTVRDSAFFSITREEWPDVATRLRSRRPSLA